MTGRAAISDRPQAGPDPVCLPASLRDAFVARSRPVTVHAGQVLIDDGTPGDDVYLIRTGFLRVSVLSASGWETVFRIMGPDELVGELAALDGSARSARVVAHGPAELAVLGAAPFRAFLAEVPGAGLWLAQQLARRVRNLSDRAFELASLPVGGRLIAELLRLPAQGAGDSRRVARLPTHAELAARIGTHRETVTRELRGLAARGLIAQNGRALTIASSAALAAAMEGLRR